LDELLKRYGVAEVYNAVADSCRTATALRGQTGCFCCGKGHPKVKGIVAGPGVHICIECIDLCHKIRTKERGEDNTS